MKSKKNSLSRRNFIKTIGTVGVGSFLPFFDSLSKPLAISGSNESQFKFIPTRPFGKTKVNVPILCLGTTYSRSSDLLLKRSIDMGVRFWDTAAIYSNGNEEKAIGKYFRKYPEDRNKIFLLTKSHSLHPDKWSKDLKKSLERMNTSYLDLFLIHSVHHAEDLKIQAKTIENWSQKAKNKGKIRLFGFSTHRNIEENLLKASDFGFIDGIMFSYNFRNMHNYKMKKAVDACAKAEIGLIAMKTQASVSWILKEKLIPNEKEQALFNQLAKKGFTFEQAKLMAVWDDYRISSITSLMSNMSQLEANVAAANSDKKLSKRDKQFLNQYALQTAQNYCAGCASICEQEINWSVPICDIMRFLMYAKCYGKLENAKSYFAEMPLLARKRMKYINYEKAEQRCPQHMNIGRLMREATTLLS
jgi:predicted aldo/keto reductase-like oxidoreductase